MEPPNTGRVGYWRTEKREFTFAKSGCKIGLRVSPAGAEQMALGIISIDRYGSNGRQSTWRDRTSEQLEDKLGDILRDLLLRVVEHEEREDEKRREAERREREWRLAMDKARDDFAEAYRADVLLDEVARWSRARQIRGYAAEMKRCQPNNARAAEWLSWANDYARSIDPFAETISMPTVPDPKPDDLRPYLGRWNPYARAHWRIRGTPIPCRDRRWGHP